jgi:pimeloyl-ACP methyl ester carboxylesterase
MTSTYSPGTAPERAIQDAATVGHQFEQIMFALSRRIERASRDHGERIQKFWTDAADVQRRFADAQKDGKLADDARAYAIDAQQRTTLALEILRERAEQDIAHEKAGTPPVLIYDYEVVLDGKTLPRPTNKMLLKIIPPDGIEVKDWKRPYMIVDPRAGHGAGIGGFKSDSQVGVALHDGHPVYFVVFRPHPEPGQTLADVMRSEAAFVAKIRELHPDAPKPIIVGNCQGGWASLILAAMNPDISGPLVVNGAPVAYWSGRLGENPMRYNGGLLGGATPALLLSDLGGGEFDGAHLVGNFEMLNPGRNYFGKYYDMFAAPEKSRKTFLEFEKWWGGFHFMNEQEIHWIVENLFVGNKLARHEANLEPGRPIDLKAIRTPIIVFASWGDNITPPQQALNWIVDTYADEHEIKIRGQRIIYMIHDKVGHLGIFVSASIAKKEHTEVTSVMKTIEALAPGLYEMTIDEQIGEGVDARFTVSFHERKLTDILAIDENDRSDERDFAAVERFSELGTELYDIWARPIVQSLVTPQFSEALKKTNPARLSRTIFGDANPLMKGVAEQAQKVTAERKAADPNNPFLFAEKLWASGVENTLDAYRDFRDAMYELTFLGIYSSPTVLRLGEKFAFERTRKDPKVLRFLPEVQTVLLNVDRGGFEEAVIRMLILMAESRATVRRDRLERSAKVLGHDEPFASLGSEKRAALIHQQSLIVEFEPMRALASLPDLLSDPTERQRAIEVVEFIAGAIEEMEPATIQLLQRFHSVLGLKGLALPAPRRDPLTASETVRDEFGGPAPLDAVAPLAPEAVADTIREREPATNSKGRGRAREPAE